MQKNTRMLLGGVLQFLSFFHMFLWYILGVSCEFSYIKLIRVTDKSIGKSCSLGLRYVLFFFL